MLVTVEDGVALKVEGAKDHRSPRACYAQGVATWSAPPPDRVLHPMKRIGRARDALRPSPGTRRSIP